MKVPPMSMPTRQLTAAPPRSRRRRAAPASPRRPPRGCPLLEGAAQHHAVALARRRRRSRTRRARPPSPPRGRAAARSRSRRRRRTGTRVTAPAGSCAVTAFSISYLFGRADQEAVRVGRRRRRRRRRPRSGCRRDTIHATAVQGSSTCFTFSVPGCPRQRPAPPVSVVISRDRFSTGKRLSASSAVARIRLPRPAHIEPQPSRPCVAEASEARTSTPWSIHMRPCASKPITAFGMPSL